MAMKIITGYTGEKHITPIDDARLHKALFGSGDYVLPTGSQLEATIVAATEVSIADGELVMQGRYARNDSSQSLVIGNGSQGMYRNDLVVARYTKDMSTSVESVNLVVITGTATSETAADPSYNTGDIDNGETRDFPLYRVRINGITIESIDTLFETSMSLPDLGGVSIVKLWENASPTSPFTAQEFPNLFDNTIDNYSLAMGIFNVNSGGRKVVGFEFVGWYGSILYDGNVGVEASDMFTVERRWNLNRNGKLTFTDTYYTSEKTCGYDNDYLIPYAVYGIKGVR